MRERENERIQRVKDAQKRLEEIKTLIREETVTDFAGDKLTTRFPLYSREVQALETLIERNQRWVTKPRKKKAQQLPPTGTQPIQLCLRTRCESPRVSRRPVGLSHSVVAV